eukprot:1157360-Pelagomonas_calceolata.AAC.5
MSCYLMACRGTHGCSALHLPSCDSTIKDFSQEAGSQVEWLPGQQTRRISRSAPSEKACTEFELTKLLACNAHRHTHTCTNRDCCLGAS